MLTLIAGLVLGFANGIFAACTNISPFIITLGTMQIYKGASYIISGGLPIAEARTPQMKVRLALPRPVPPLSLLRRGPQR